MSVTVRLWSPAELAAIKALTDPWLATVFMNRCSFSREELSSYPYEARKEYVLVLPGGYWGPEEITFYATDDQNAARFAHAEYRLPKRAKLTRIERGRVKYKRVPLAQG